MNKIKQALRLHIDGESNREIGRKLGIYKGTVNKYVKMTKACGIPIPALLAMEEPEIERVLTNGNPAYSDNRFQALKERLPYIISELQRKHVTMYLLWREYRGENPDGYGYTQFCFHVNQFTEAQKPSFVLSDDREGGQYLFVDFAGDTLSYVDLDTGEEVRCQVFVATLPASDYGFAMAVHSQKIDDFLHALECCLRHIGGVPKIIVTDNLKAAVVKADRYEPAVNRVLEDMANHYGCFVQPARPLHPKDKALVEDHVKLVYRRVYAELRNRVFHSLEELNEAVAEKMAAHNRKRMQQHPYTREERFLAVDRPNLLPLPETDFEIRCHTDLKVSPNCCIYLGRDRHYYSVPFRLVGRQVHVEYTRTLVKVYSEGELVATHGRDRTPGKYTVVNEHLASHSLEYRNLSPDRYVERGWRALPELGELFKQMFMTSRMPPEMHYKTCDGLLALQRHTDPDLFRTACLTAVRFGRYNYHFVLQLVKSRCEGLRQQDPQCPPDHANIRGPEQFS